MDKKFDEKEQSEKREFGKSRQMKDTWPSRTWLAYLSRNYDGSFRRDTICTRAETLRGGTVSRDVRE